MAISQRSLIGAAALALVGCAYQPVVAPVPTSMKTEPLANSYPQRQMTYTTVAWNAGGVLGPCVASETSETQLPASARGLIARELNMDQSAAETFAQLRTGARIVCGYDNPLAKPFVTAERAPRPTRNAAPVVTTPAFSNVTMVKTGEYLVADKALQCRGTVVMVQPESIKPGHPQPGYVNGPIKQFGGIAVPAGYAVPTSPIADRYGNRMASSMACESVMTFSKPIALQ